MHAYRTHTCAALRASDAGATVRLSGWVHRKRDHGGVLFLDLRDHYGLTQCVVGQGSPVFALADGLRSFTARQTVLGVESGDDSLSGGSHWLIDLGDSGEVVPLPVDAVVDLYLAAKDAAVDAGRVLGFPKKEAFIRVLEHGGNPDNARQLVERFPGAERDVGFHDLVGADAGCTAWGLAADAAEYLDEPALVLWLSDLPAAQWRGFDGRHPLADEAACCALVHADPETPELGELLHELAGLVAPRILGVGDHRGDLGVGELLPGRHRAVGGAVEQDLDLARRVVLDDLATVQRLDRAGALAVGLVAGRAVGGVHLLAARDDLGHLLFDGGKVGRWARDLVLSCHVDLALPLTPGSDALRQQGGRGRDGDGVGLRPVGGLCGDQRGLPHLAWQGLGLSLEIAYRPYPNLQRSS